MRQICNIAVYISHSACTIHLLNLPNKNAARDIVHGIKHLEEIGESWLCARRTLGILETVARRWKIELPQEAIKILQRTDAKFDIHKYDHGSPRSNSSGLHSSIMTPVYQNMNNPSPHFTSQNHGLFNASPAEMNTVPNPEPSRNGGTTSLPLQSASDEHLQEQCRILPQVQPELWSQGVVPQVPMSQVPVSQAAVDQIQTSPSTLFGGIESLVEESQDWWLKDQAQFFDNWLAPEQGGELMDNNVVNDIGISGYDGNSYGINGGANVMPGNSLI